MVVAIAVAMTAATTAMAAEIERATTVVMEAGGLGGGDGADATW